MGAGLAAAGPRLAVVALLLVAIASGAVLARRLTPAQVLCAGAALAVLSGNWGLLGMPFGIDRLVVLAGVAATLVAAARDPELRLVARPVHLALAATSAWAVCSALLAGTLSNTVAIYSLMDRFGIVPFLAFFVAPYAFRTLAARLALVKTLVLVASTWASRPCSRRWAPPPSCSRASSWTRRWGCTSTARADPSWRPRPTGSCW